jgi:hypothetical protein
MRRKITTSYLLLFTVLLSLEIYSQVIDSTSFTLNSRLSFYSFENEAEMILGIPEAFRSTEMNITLTIDGMIVKELMCKPGKKLLMVPFKTTMSQGKYEAMANIEIKGINYSATTIFIVLNYKPNEVKVDRFTGGMVVNRRPFFPFGFYCYSPVHQTLPEEEVVKGFNMISPYQNILPRTITERKAYMDRCALLGMKVHYNLLSVSGGGGVVSSPEDITDEEKRRLLINEIQTFKDHPALLAWYIADEPTGNGKTPGELLDIYNIVKENDPWHPVSIVFNAPFLSSKKYANSLDIVMADPYPVPNGPVSIVGETAKQLNEEFSGAKAVWFVPQAFGGSEWWPREPTLQEVRSMTYQSIIMGARGIQYFIRQGLNAFPKSTATWGECGRIAMEVAEMTPWLLSDEETIPVQSNYGNVLVTSELHDGQLLVLAVNTINEPQKVSVRISGKTDSKALVWFENRIVKIIDGTITDYISPFGSQAYLINLNRAEETTRSTKNNFVLDPGFEDMSSPGVPASCYARPGKDKGATFFLDSREHYEGNHSLRLVTPTDNNGAKLTFYPFIANPGSTYKVSVWAKSDKEQRLEVKRTFWDKLFGRKKPVKQYFELGLGAYGSGQFVPDSVWQEYVTYVTIPIDQDTLLKTNLTLQMPGSGVAWFDNLQVIEDPLITSYIDPDTKLFMVKGFTKSDNVTLRYTTDSTTPTKESMLLTNPVSISNTVTFKTGIFVKDTIRGVTEKQFIIHKATAKNVTYLNTYLSQYDGGGRFALTDGIKGGLNHLDGKWQAFIGKDAEIIIDLEQKTEIKKIAAGFLQNPSYWIFMPSKMEVYGSDDGLNWTTLGSAENNVADNERGYVIQNIPVEFNPVSFRFLKIIARSIKVCPVWHSGRGKACYMFIDEIVVE